MHEDNSRLSNRYRKIRSVNQLYQHEQKMLTISAKTIGKQLYQRFLEKKALGIAIHDRDLQAWALEIKKQLDPDDTFPFKASISWVYKFKLRYNIFLRQITKEISLGQNKKKCWIRSTISQLLKETKYPRAGWATVSEYTVHYAE